MQERPSSSLPLSLKLFYFVTLAPALYLAALFSYWRQQRHNKEIEGG